MADATRETVLLWMTANNAGPAAASRQFGIPANRIKQWAHVARQGVPVAPAHPERPNLTILPPPPEVKVALPPSVEKLAQSVVKLALASIIKQMKKGDASIADCAKAISAVTDRLQVFGDIAKAEQSPGDADQLADAGAVRAELLRRRRG